MIIFDPEVEYTEPINAEFICFGGTYVCATVSGYKKPIRGRLQEIVERGMPPYLAKRFEKISVRDAELFGDSNQFRADPDLTQMVQEVRSLIQNSRGNIHAVMGTDQAAASAHALAEGISREELGKRAIIIEVAQENIPTRELTEIRDDEIIRKSNVGRVLENGLYLSLRKELQGCITVLGGSHLYPARGLRKVNTVADDPFSGRFDSIGYRTNDPKWVIAHPERLRAAMPRGDGNGIKFSMGVEVKDLGITADYRNLYEDVRRSIPSWWERKFLHKTSHYKGIVLNAPGEGSVREYEKDLELLVKTADIAARHGIYMVLVGDPHQPKNPLFASPDEYYTGGLARVQRRLYGPPTRKKKGRTFIGGGKLTATEARLLLSAAIAQRVDVEQYCAEYSKFLESKH